MLFTGEYEHTIDAKGRLAIPSDIRGRMNPERDGEALYLTLGRNRTLRLYPERVFERLSEQVEQGLVPDEAVREFEELIFPLSTRLEFDSAGRIRVPDRMTERAGLETKQVILLGVRDHMEIWSREAWQAKLDERLDKQGEIFDRYARRTNKNASDGPSDKETATG